MNHDLIQGESHLMVPDPRSIYRHTLDYAISWAPRTPINQRILTLQGIGITIAQFSKSALFGVSDWFTAALARLCRNEEDFERIYIIVKC